MFGAAGDAGGVNVFGLQAAVNIFFQEQANDRLTLNALGGDDVVNATSLEADGIQLTMNGGLGDDIFIGSEGDDLFNGGDGNDTALMGAGDDTFVWNPGDDNDTLEGQDGFDTMLFNGANAAEQINIFANGGRVLFTRDIANVVMDLNDVEGIDFNALGGADTITVNDLSGTDVTEINLNLGQPPAAAPATRQPDTVIVIGTNGDDVALVVGDASGTSASSAWPPQVNITGAEAANDRLTVNALAGDDVVEASGLAAGAIQLTADGGDGNDVLVGGDGNDVLLGGDGDDVLVGGPDGRPRRRPRRQHRDPELSNCSSRQTRLRRAATVNLKNNLIRLGKCVMPVHPYAQALRAALETIESSGGRAMSFVVFILERRPVWLAQAAAEFARQAASTVSAALGERGGSVWFERHTALRWRRT